MDKNIEGQEPQNIPKEVVEETKEVGKVIIEEKTLTSEEIAELQKRADSSSQNFERLKKVEKDNEDLKAQLSDNPIPNDYYSDDVSELKSKVSEMETELNKNKLQRTYPELEETWSDFEIYLDDPTNSGMKLETSAKAFLVEKGLFGQKRKGLEKSTGGQKKPSSSGMSIEDIENIRKNNGKKYREMIKKGQIKFKN